MKNFDPEIHHPILLRMVRKELYKEYAKVCAKQGASVGGSLTELLNKYMAEVIRISK